jgi:cytoskeletal protein RodZ
LYMWIFDRKPNQQPASPDLPPELRPFYGTQKAKSLRARRFLAVISLLVILVAAVFVGLWLHGRLTSATHAKATTHSTTQAAKPSHSTQNSSSAKPQTEPAISSQPTQPATVPSAMPNTGPGMNIFLASIGSGLIGAILYHIRQVRTTSEKRF